jgi:hypothetical protein
VRRVDLPISSWLVDIAATDLAGHEEDLKEIVGVGRCGDVPPSFRLPDAAADLLDDLHVRFQSSGLIAAFPSDTAFRLDGWIQWSQRHIIVVVLKVLHLF